MKKTVGMAILGVGLVLFIAVAVGRRVMTPEDFADLGVERWAVLPVMLVGGGLLAAGWRMIVTAERQSD